MDRTLALHRLRQPFGMTLATAARLPQRAALSVLAAMTARFPDRHLLAMTSLIARGARRSLLAAGRHRLPCHLHRDDALRLMHRRGSVRLFRELRRRHYASSSALRWYARVRSTEWIDPCAHLSNLQASTRMIALLQTGEYLLALACMICRSRSPGRFHLFLPGPPSPALKTLMRALMQLGHWIQLGDSSAPDAQLTMVRRMRAGVTVIAFIDDAGGQAHLQGPEDVPLAPTHPSLHAAYLAGSSVILVAHRIDDGETAGVHVLCHTPPVCPTTMCRRLTFHANRFISADPANWVHH